MKHHLPPHSFRPGELLIQQNPGEVVIVIKIFCSRFHGYDFEYLEPKREGFFCSEDLLCSDAFFTDGWEIFEVSGKMSRETPGELERRRGMIAEARLLLLTVDHKRNLEQRFGPALDRLTRESRDAKHFSAPPFVSTPYTPTLPPEHRPKLHITAYYHVQNRSQQSRRDHEEERHRPGDPSSCR